MKLARVLRREVLSLLLLPFITLSLCLVLSENITEPLSRLVANINAAVLFIRFPVETSEIPGKNKLSGYLG